MKKLCLVLLALLASACSPVTIAQPFEGGGKPAMMGDYWSVLNDKKEPTGLLIFTDASEAYYVNADMAKKSPAVNPNLSARGMAQSLKSSFHYENLHCTALDDTYHACSMNLNGSEDFTNMIGLYQKGSDSVAWFVPKLEGFIKAADARKLKSTISKNESGHPTRIHLEASQKRVIAFLKKLPKNDDHYSRSYLIPISEKAARNTLLQLQGKIKKR